MKTTRHGLFWVIAGAAMVIASSTTGCGSDDEGDNNVNLGGSAGQAGLGGGAGSSGKGGAAGTGGTAGNAGQGGAGTGGAAGKGGAAGAGGAANGGASGEGGAATGGAAGEGGAATGGAAGEGGAATGGAAGEGGAATGGAAGEGGAATGGAAGEGGASTGGSAGTGGSGGNPPVGTLFFSEYVEGSTGNNKALGIYNAGNSAYDLTQCVVNRYTGATTLQSPASVFPAGATLQPGDEYVLCDGNPAPGATLSALCDYIDDNLNYNGDDALALDCGGVRLDIIGQIGTDPGTAWGTGDLSTADRTLRRKCNITQGDVIPDDAFDPSVEWVGAGKDVFDGLGTRGCVQQTIQIDGTNDFPSTATFTTSSTGYTGYITWDATSVYLGMNGPDVAGSSGQRWWQIYIGTGASPNTTTGQQYTGQQPTLPFPARYHVRWKADNSYTNAQVWDGTQWAEASWDFTGAIYQSGTLVELRIPKSAIGSPTDHLQVVMAMVEEATPGWTYAGVPSSTFTDKADANFASYYDFDLNSGALPSTYSPKP